MAESPTNILPEAPCRAAADDRLRLRRWFFAYAAYLGASLAVAGLMIHQQGWTWGQLTHDPVSLLQNSPLSLKLLASTVYLSMCMTFFPLPTGWIVALLGTREAAILTGLPVGSLSAALATAAVVGAVGGFGSTMANLTDYNIFTLMLRNKRVAALRDTHSYQAVQRWFARSPFMLVTTFNVLPLPVDVIRVMAATYRYPRIPFAAANFIGRFLRYGTIAFVTYWWNLGGMAVIALFALAATIVLVKLEAVALRKAFGAKAPQQATEAVK